MPAGICDTCRRKLQLAEDRVNGMSFRAFDAPDITPVEFDEVACSCRLCRTAVSAGRPSKRLGKPKGKTLPHPVKKLSAEVFSDSPGVHELVEPRDVEGRVRLQKGVW